MDIMPQHIEIIIALAVPLAVLMLLRINAALVFLSVCLGYVLVELVAKDANSLVTFLAPEADSLSKTTWQLVLLLAPVVVTCVIMLFSVKGRLRALINVVPAVAVSVLLVLLIVPLLTPGLRYELQAAPLWQQLHSTQSAIVSLGAFVSLVLLWTQRQMFHKSGRGRH